MSRFQKIKQKNQKKILQKQIDETQKKLVRGTLSLIGVLMILVFIFGNKIDVLDLTHIHTMEGFRDHICRNVFVNTWDKY